MLSVIIYSLMLDSVTTVAVLSCQGALSAAWGRPLGAGSRCTSDLEGRCTAGKATSTRLSLFWCQEGHDPWRREGAILTFFFLNQINTFEYFPLMFMWHLRI